MSSVAKKENYKKQESANQMRIISLKPYFISEITVKKRIMDYFTLFLVDYDYGHTKEGFNKSSTSILKFNH